MAAWALGVLEHLEETIGVISSERSGIRDQLVEELSLVMGQPAFVQARHKGRRDSLQDAYRQVLGGL